MIVGCYTLHLYCDNEGKFPDGIHSHNEFPHEFINEFGSKCRVQARRKGWILNEDGTAYCPKCALIMKQTKV